MAFLSFPSSCGLHEKDWPRRSPISQRFSPRLEALEDRTLLAVQLLHHYNGLDFLASGTGPPDTVGAAGPTNYIETVNSIVAIYTPKDTGATSARDQLDHFFFVTGRLPHASSASFLNDASMLWDDQVQRFIVADHDLDRQTGASHFDIAVSKSASPATLTAADWNFYWFNTDEAGFIPDYQGNMGYNHDAFVWTFNMAASYGAKTDHVEINAVSIADLVAGVSSPAYVQTQTPPEFGAFLRPTVMHDSVAGDSVWFVQDSKKNFTNTTIKVIQEIDPLTTPSFTVTTLTVASKFAPVNPLQPDGTTVTTTDFTLLPFVQKAAEYNRTIVATEMVSPNQAGTEDDARWYEINVSSGTPTLADEGDVSAGPNTYIIYPAIDINAQGLIGMTYMESGRPAPFLSVFVTGRLPGDPAGRMETPVLVQAGATNYHDPSGGGRAGDFSGISVDTDGTFWIANEFANTEATVNWGTTIAHFTFFGPLAAMGLDITATVSVAQDFTVAEFSDPDATAPTGRYAVPIDFGDGTPVQAGTVTQAGGPGTPFLIDATHTYDQTGTFTVDVRIFDEAETSAETFSTATVISGAAPRAPGNGGASRWVRTFLVAISGVQAPAACEKLQRVTTTTNAGAPSATPLLHPSATLQARHPESGDLYWRLMNRGGEEWITDPHGWPAHQLSLALEGMWLVDPRRPC